MVGCTFSKYSKAYERKDYRILFQDVEHCSTMLFDTDYTTLWSDGNTKCKGS